VGRCSTGSDIEVSVPTLVWRKIFPLRLRLLGFRCPVLPHASFFTGYRPELSISLRGMISANHHGPHNDSWIVDPEHGFSVLI
jgi:hypothetical protein